MAQTLSWFRFYHEALDDPKVQSLSGEDFKFWVNLLCLCCRRNGLPKNLDEVSFAMRRSPHDCFTVLSRLADGGLLDRVQGGRNGSHYAIHGWDKRQYKSDTSTDRVKRFRQRFRNVSATACETGPETETETETDTDYSRTSSRNLNS